MTRPVIGDSEVEAFQSDGYVLLKGFFSQREIERLGERATHDRMLDQKSFSRDDGEGGAVRLAIWNHPTDTIYGAVARSESLVSCVERLLGGEVYHYHSKMIMKDARTGGAWAWHQDYGYWYQNGVLFPELVSAFIAVDPSTRENGCLQVIRGSHKLGRVDHGLTGDQARADEGRVAEILKRLELVYVEMDPGDVLFFHANMLHRSEQNTSENSRWSMICCYNAAWNDPFKESHHPRYTPLIKAPDALILEMADRGFEAAQGGAWVADTEDVSATTLRRRS